ncbi:MAG: alpha/beta hydrolase [Ramlibacter sp.]|jgi:alpha/beta superfamily hydrolase|nr:alpha/beta hydrolase [Ramlibacter sp.]MCE3273318.1 alpha/beta hydrolase [Ramlibacter sp.]
MNAQTERLELAGAAGRIQALRDRPDGTPRGVAVIAHPHPLFGGTMDNKVVQTLARAFVQCGWTAVRFNFRGVGASEGSFDEGRGEAADFQQVVQAVAPEGALALAGFSFGAFVAAQAVEALWNARDVQSIVLVGTAASRFGVPPLPPDSHDRALVIHGEQDDTVLLSAVLDWARPQSLPVTVVPGVEHFFHGQLPLLKGLVVRHLRTQG